MMNTEIYKTLREHIGEKPDSLVFARLAQMLYESGNSKAAFTILEKGLEQNPSYITGYIILGDLLYKSGKVDKAKQTYRKALELDPFNLAVLQSLMDIELSNGNYRAVAAYVLQILTIDPNNHIAYDILVQNWDKIDEALPELTREPEPELPAVDVEKIGGGTFSLIGTEPIQEIKHLPLVVRTMPEELQALEHMTNAKTMAPVELNEVEQEINDLVEMDEIFKAFKAPVSEEEVPVEQTETPQEVKPLSPQEQVQETPIGESQKYEIDLSYDEVAPESAVEEKSKAEKIEPVREPKPTAFAPPESDGGKEEEQDILDWGLEDEETEISQEIEAAGEQVSQEEQLAEEKAITEAEQESEMPSEISGDIFEFDFEESEGDETETVSSEKVAEIGEKIIEEQISEKEPENPTEEPQIEIPQGTEESAKEISEGEKTAEQETIDTRSIETESDIPEIIFEMEETAPAEEESAEISETDESIQTESGKKEIPEIELPEDVFKIDDIGAEKSEVSSHPEESVEMESEESPEEETTYTPQKIEDKTEEESIKSAEEKIEDLLSSGKIFDIPESESTEEAASVDEILKEPDVSPEQKVEIGGDEIEIPENIFSAEDVSPSRNEDEIVLEDEDSLSLDEVVKQIESSAIVDTKPTEKTIEEIGQDKITETPVDEQLQPEQSTNPSEIETEKIEGIQQRDDTTFVPPEETEDISGLDTRTDFTPPDSGIEIEGLEKRPENPFEEIPKDVLEPLLEDKKETETQNIPQHLPQAPSAPPKDVKTATAAEIYAAQGMTEKAIEIYEQILESGDISEQEKALFENRLKILRERLNKGE